MLRSNLKLHHSPIQRAYPLLVFRYLSLNSLGLVRGDCLREGFNWVPCQPIKSPIRGQLLYFFSSVTTLPTGISNRGTAHVLIPASPIGYWVAAKASLLSASTTEIAKVVSYGISIVLSKLTVGLHWKPCRSKSSCSSLLPSGMSARTVPMSSIWQ